MHIYDWKNACTHPHVSCFTWGFFKKIPTILLEGIKIFNDKIARKLPLVILIGWSLDIARYLKFTRPEKDLSLLAWHGKWEDPENERAWKWATTDARKDFSSDKNGDKFNEGERDYWWSWKACILERWHRSIYCVKPEQPWWIRRIKEKSEIGRASCRERVCT